MQQRRERETVSGKDCVNKARGCSMKLMRSWRLLSNEKKGSVSVEAHVRMCAPQSSSFFIYMNHFWSLYWICYNLLLLFYVLIFCPQGMWDLSSLTRDWTWTTYSERWSLHHWATREVPWNLGISSDPFLLVPWLELELLLRNQFWGYSNGTTLFSNTLWFQNWIAIFSLPLTKWP